MDVDFYINKAERLGVSRFYREYLRVLLASGCRVSSLFLLYGEAITVEGNLLIYQYKGSRPLFYDTGSSRSWWRSLKLSGNSDITRANRQYFYRLCSRLGIVHKAAGNVHSYVTHAARAARAAEVWNSSRDVDAVAAALGHRSVRSAKYYIDELRQSSSRQRGVLTAPDGVLNHLYINKNGVIYWK